MRPQLSADALAVLERLGRPGSRLRHGPNGIVLATHRSERTVAVSAPHIGALRAAGLLTAGPLDHGAATEILSAAGHEVLRRRLVATNRHDAPTATRIAPAPRITRPILKRRGRHAVLDADAVAAPSRPLERRSVVEQLHHRRDALGQRLVSETQLAAAQRFANDFVMAQLQPRVTAQWSVVASANRRTRGGSSGYTDISEAASAAQARVRSALAGLGGALADIILDVCGFDHGLEAIESRHGWPARSGRVALQLALDSLARHYGMSSPPSATPTATIASRRHWGTADFRPDPPGRQHT